MTRSPIRGRRLVGRRCRRGRASGLVRAKAGNGPDRRLDLLGGDEPRAFELARRVLVARAPQKIAVIEAMAHVVPAAVAGVLVDDAVRRIEFVGRVGEARDHHHRRAGRPGEPGQAAGEADEEFGVLDPARALGQRLVAGLVLGAVRDDGSRPGRCRGRASGRCR